MNDELNLNIGDLVVLCSDLLPLLGLEETSATHFVKSISGEKTAIVTGLKFLGNLGGEGEWSIPYCVISEVIPLTTTISNHTIPSGE